ncbi:serine protease inhibitor 27A-like [Zootermopsis nevadensis]|uniref:Serpin B8 n=1 Tax=Zootermopsis nevadensis TaxID=136037 RepID=A0A067QXD8_ZOONE|nr:serine protease inhibitor 27A-like [Zootermopsis nevadensis]KDR09408.1 Serpin B8 [Zootermopsis nevadensis]
MAKFAVAGPHLAVLLVVLRVAGAAPADASSEASLDLDYYDDDLFVPPTNEGNFDVFDWQLCKHMAHEETGNMVVSPVSIKLLLAMLYEGAAGNTALQLGQALNLPQRLESRKKFTAVLDSLLTKKPEYLLHVGTRMYVRKDVTTRPRFSKILQSFYNASIHNIDFQESSKAVETVNSWVSEITNGKIKTMFSADTVNPSTVLLLVNAIYFKGLWRYPFNESYTRPGKFQVTPSQSVTVPYMTMERDLYWTESVELESSILRLPYMGNKYSMFIVLPNKPDGLNKLVNTASPALLRNQLFHMVKGKVGVRLPKFSFDFTARLENSLQALGIRDIFNDSAANLPGMTREKSLYVSKAIQKAGLEVNERGTTAFASTGIQLDDRFGSEVTFHATHPFMFFIQDETMGTVIFVGKLTNPNTEPGSLRNPDDRPRVTDNVSGQGLLESRLGAENSRQQVPDKPQLTTPRSPKRTFNPISSNTIEGLIPHKVWAYISEHMFKLQRNVQ